MKKRRMRTGERENECVPAEGTVPEVPELLSGRFGVRVSERVRDIPAICQIAKSSS